MWRWLTYYLAENPWYLAGSLGLVGAGFLVAMRVTADGRYLKRALVALGMAAGVVVVEQAWVTDAERIEKVVYDLIDAVSRSEADRALGLLDDRVTLSLRGGSADEINPDLIRRVLGGVTFDWLRAGRLTAAAGEQTGRGSAEFRLSASGTYHMMVGSRNFYGNSEWSLGFRKLRTGEWKVNRITAISLPQFVNLGELLRRAGPQVPPPTPSHPDVPTPDGTRTFPRPGRPRR